MNTKKKGVLFVINDFNVGGAEIFVLRLGQALSEKYTIFITDVRPHAANTDFKNQFLASNFVYIQNNYHPNHVLDWLLWKVNAFLSIFGIRNVYQRLLAIKKRTYWEKTIRQKNIFIVNSHLLASDEYVFQHIFPCKNLTNLKWILTMHSSYNPLHYSDLYLPEKQIFFDRVIKIMNATDHIVGVSNENFIIFNEIDINKKPQKIYLGFSPKRWDSPMTSLVCKKILMIGRGIREKGWEIFLEAISKIDLEKNNIEVYLVGPLTQYMEELRLKFHSSRIFFEGYQKEPSNYYREAFLTVLPSHGESLPYTVIESLGYGIPVLVSNRGEMPQMIREDETFAGVLIGDDETTGLPSVNELYQSILYLIENKEQYHLLKKNTDKVFTKFSIQNCVKEYEKLFYE